MIFITGAEKPIVTAVMYKDISDVMPAKAKTTNDSRV